MLRDYQVSSFSTITVNVRRKYEGNLTYTDVCGLLQCIKYMYIQSTKFEAAGGGGGQDSASHCSNIHVHVGRISGF